MKACAVLLLACAMVHASAFHETFSEGWETRWIHSDDDKYSGRFAVEKSVEGLDDVALKVTEKAKHYGISASLPEPVDPSKGPLVLQFEVKLAEGLSCGGAYLKFLTADSTFTPSGLKDDTPYTVMFGPDKCGSTNKVHLILRHKSPKTGKVEEKHLKYPPAVPDSELTHVFTAILRPENNSYAVLIDGEESKAGSLFEDFDPPFVPATEIDDPADSKPSSWVDEAKIADPTAKKPEDWDEDAPEFVPDEDAEKPEGWLDEEPSEVDDPEAAKPDDWDDEEDGDWEPPQVPNPKCTGAPGCGPWVRPTKPNPAFKGKWSAPMIDNPAYKGPWAPRKIANPDFFNDTAPLEHIGAVGAVAAEIWTMDEGYYFDNVVITDSPDLAAQILEATWKPKHEVEEAAAAEKKVAAEVEAKKAADAAAPGFTEKLGERVTGLVEAVFASKLLAPVSGTLEPVRRALVGYPLVVLAGVVALVALVLTPVVGGFLSRNSEAVAVGQAKKNDDAAPAGASAAQEEIQEEEEEEKEEATPAARRRARRD